MIKIRTRYSTVPVVQVDGDVVGDDAGSLKSTLLELADRGFDNLALQLSGVSSIDNAGIGALLAARGRVAQVGGRLTLVACSSHLLSDLENTGMTDLFDCQPELPEHEKQS